jgi:hypothetical protein
MIKPNTWHDALDLKICSRFFKYKLVLDDARNKLTRDRTLLQNAINRGQSSDETPTEIQTTDLPTRSQAGGKGLDDTSKCACCRCPNIPETSKNRPPVDRNGAESPTWELPCELKTVVEVIDDLFPDIDALTKPLTEINQMVRSLFNNC